MNERTGETGALQPAAPSSRDAKRGGDSGARPRLRGRGFSGKQVILIFSRFQSVTKHRETLDDFYVCLFVFLRGSVLALSVC